MQRIIKLSVLTEKAEKNIKSDIERKKI